MLVSLYLSCQLPKNVELIFLLVFVSVVITNSSPAMAQVKIDVTKISVEPNMCPLESEIKLCIDFNAEVNSVSNLLFVCSRQHSGIWQDKHYKQNYIQEKIADSWWDVVYVVGQGAKCHVIPVRVSYAWTCVCCDVGSVHLWHMVSCGQRLNMRWFCLMSLVSFFAWFPCAPLASWLCDMLL